MHPPMPDQGISLRQAVWFALFGFLMTMAAPFAEFYVRPTLIIPGNIEETVRNILANEGLFLAGTFAYLMAFIGDVILAWALYVLLAPVNRSLSLLTAWFRLVYSVIAIAAVLNLATVYRLLNSPESLSAFGSEQLHAQVLLLLNSFQWEWSMGLVLFGVHLGLLGYLVYRSGYIPRAVGFLLVVAGSGYVIADLRPYLYPDAKLGFVTITFFGELVFALWLLVRGRKIEEPEVHRTGERA